MVDVTDWLTRAGIVAVDLGDAPAAPNGRALGVVSVVIVPTGDDDRPQPAPDLLDHVQAHLGVRGPPPARLMVLGPAYASVSVEARIACAGAAAAGCGNGLPSAAGRAPAPGPRRGRLPGLGTGWQTHRCDLLVTLGALLVDGTLTGLPLALLLLGGGAAGASVGTQWALCLGLTGAAFVGVIGAVLLVLARGVQPSLRLLLAGVIVGVVLGAMKDLVTRAAARLNQRSRTDPRWLGHFIGTSFAPSRRRS